jgi:hypothetical protein
MVRPIFQSRISIPFPDALIPFVDPSAGEPPVGASYVATPVRVAAGHNLVFWVDIAVPANARAGEYKGRYTVSSDERTIRGSIRLHVWNFTMPREPALRSSFNGGGIYVPGLQDELLCNNLMPDYAKPASEPGLIKKFGHFATDLQFWDGVCYGYCPPTAPPSVAAVEKAKAAQEAGLYLYDDLADLESFCTNDRRPDTARLYQPGSRADWPLVLECQ